MFSAFQVDPTSVMARSNEGLRLMKALWTETRVNFDGRFWQLKDAAMEPKTFQKPFTTAQFAAQVPIVRQALADGRRDAGAFGIAKRVYIAVDDDAQRARANRHGAAPILFVLRLD